MAGPRVFVSHSHHDTVFAHRLVADLKAAGAEVWIDVVNINSGDFQERINEALGACHYFVLVLTPEALAAPWVRMETNAAIKRKMQGHLQDILPIVAKSVDPLNIPPTWDVFQRFDAVVNYSAALSSIVRAIGLSSHQSVPENSQQMVLQARRQDTQTYDNPIAQQPYVPLSQHIVLPRKKTNAGLVAVIVTTLAVLLICSCVGLVIYIGAQRAGTAISSANIQLAAATQVSLFCTDFMSQDYGSAYQLLSTAEQGRVSQTAFATREAALDTSAGTVATCTLDSSHPLPAISSDGKSATAQVQVARGDNTNLATGKVNLVYEDGAWKVDSADSSLKLL